VSDPARTGAGREFAVGERPSLDVSIAKGTLDVRNGVDGRITIWLDRPDDWIVDHAGDSVSVHPKDRWRSRSSRVVVEVPHGARLDVRAAAARARLDGEFGEVCVSSASGDVHVTGACAGLSASSASGDVRCGTVHGDVEVKSASGDVDVAGVTGRLAVTTMSGDVRLATVGAELAVATASGDVEVQRADGDAIAVRTVSGDVHLGLPGGIRVAPNLSTISGRTRLPEPRPATADHPEAVPRLVRVDVKTVSGDIDIARAE
jgi:DUF4097 and DUF4098 domain-containing protein YvlB